MRLRAPIPLRRVPVSPSVAGLGHRLTAAAGPVAADPRPRPGRTEARRQSQYRVLGPRTLADRNAVARTGAAIDYFEHGVPHISATASRGRGDPALGFRLEAVPAPPTPAGAGESAPWPSRRPTPATTTTPR